MKDHDMKTRNDIEKGKKVVDGIIARINSLEEELYDGMQECCNNGDFENRTRFARMLGALNRAKGEMYDVRAHGAEVRGGGFEAQSGGT